MDVDSLVGTVLSELSAVDQDVAGNGGMVVVTALTRDVAVSRPVRETATAKVHGYHRRTVTGVPVGRSSCACTPGRLVCPVLGCRRQSFRKQGGRSGDQPGHGALVAQEHCARTRSPTAEQWWRPLSQG